MSEKERILMECRYYISLNKSYKELADIFNVSENTIYNDLNERLFNVDKTLYHRVKTLIKGNIYK